METSTTGADNPNPSDVPADTTTTTAPEPTDSQTAPTGDTPTPSKSDDTTVVADDDKSKETPTDKPTDATPAPFDDDIDDWAAKKGLPKAENDDQRRAFQAQRDGQREFTRTQQAKKDADNAADLGAAAKDAKGAVTGDDDDDEEDPLEQRLTAVEKQRDEERTTRLQSEFYITNKVSDAEHQAILTIFKEKTSRPTTDEGKRAAIDLWSDPNALPDLLDLAKARLANSTDTSAVADEAAQAERERIAKESESKSPSRSAQVTSTDSKTAAEQRTEALKARYSSNK